MLARYKSYGVDCPKPISDLKNVFSGEECVTASCLRPLLKHLHNEVILAEKEGDTTLKNNIQQRIKEYMKAKYDSRAH